MPVSRKRKPKKAVYTPPPQAARRRSQAVSPPWMGPAILGLFLLGVAWLLMYYFSNGGTLGLQHIGAANLVIGFGLIVGGLVLATQWR